MNIIGNNCIGGFIYRDLLKTKYENPFIWSRLLSPHFENLLLNWDNINFQNIDLKCYSKLDDWRIIIDNKIEVEYRHMKFDKNYNTPVIQDVFVYYNKIWEYIIEKYNTRLIRMTNKIDLVAIDDNPGYKYDLNKIINCCIDKKLFICTDRMEEIKTDKLLIVKRYHEFDTDCGQPVRIVNRYNNEIKEFLCN